MGGILSLLWPFRPPNIPVGGLGFYWDSSFFLFLHVPSELAQRNSTKIGHVVRSKRNLKTHVQNLEYHLPLQIGGPKPLFFDDFNLTASLTACIPGTKQDIHKCVTQKIYASALTTTWGLLHCVKSTCTLVHKRLQTGLPFLPTLRILCFVRHCQASQTDTSKRNSTKLCQTVVGKSR